ncbi:MAG: sugar-binding protein [Armatimonadota bacterium]
MTYVRLAALSLWLLLAFTGAIPAQEPDKPITQLAAQWCRRAPTIDGKLAEGEWAGATKAETRLVLYGLPNVQPTKVLPTTVYVANDGASLYLALVIKGEDYDAIWEANNVRVDAVAVRFDSDNDGRDSLGDDQKVVIAANSIYLDQYRVKLDPPDDFADDPQRDGRGALKHSTEAREGDYTAELSIPLDTNTAEDFAAEPGGEVSFQILYVNAFGTQAGPAIGLVAASGTIQDALAGTLPNPWAKLKLAQQP